MQHFPFLPLISPNLVGPTATGVVAYDLSRDAAIGVDDDMQRLNQSHAGGSALRVQIRAQFHRHFLGGVGCVGVVFIGLSSGVVGAGGLADSGQVVRCLDNEVVNAARIWSDVIGEADGSVQVHILAG